MPLTTKRFTLFHLSLPPIAQPSFDTETELSRELWLSSRLKEAFSFKYRGSLEYYWLPKSVVDGIITGLIQRQIKRPQHLPPEEGGAETLKAEWQGAWVIIDPTHHDDGQKMAVEQDIVGQPAALAKALCDHLNRLSEAPYITRAEQIFDEHDYHQFLKDHGTKLKQIKFTFVPPNMWKVRQKVERGLKEIRQDTGGDVVTLGLGGKNGVDGESDFVKESVAYAARGAGNVQAKSMSGDKFNSEQSAKVTEIVVEDEDQSPTGNHWSRRFKSLAIILGRKLT